MNTWSQMIVLWWLFIGSQIPFDYMAQCNDGTKSFNKF